MAEPGRGLKPFHGLSTAQLRRVAFVLTDIDGTITQDGRIPATAYRAMERLSNAGIRVIPITGRPVGWCDMIARTWPVDGVVGENGAFYFRYDPVRRCLLRRYWLSPAERAASRRRLASLERRILEAVPGATLAADQAYRETDLAIDICEDVKPLSDETVARILALFEEAGAQAKLSSIHVNGWYGDFDKLAMTKRLFAEVYRIDTKSAARRILFVGDSPNDAPMFAHFPLSVGVANIRDFAGRLGAEPAWVTHRASAAGFVELVRALLAVRNTDTKSRPS